MSYSRPCGDETPVRRLREHAADVPWRVEAGVSLPETVDRRPLSELARLPTRATWVPRQRVIDDLVQAEPALRGELADALPDTVNAP
jgi:hypothetical protein